MNAIGEFARRTTCIDLDDFAFEPVDQALQRLDQAGGPCYRCLYSEADENLEDCRGQGILAPVAGTVGCMMATEAIKIMVGLSSELNGRLWLYDALGGKSRTISIPQRDDCPVCNQSTGS